ncbi:hypothetical protein RJ639_013839 [Escallonia herrerae]|uniref:Uncharacterized protein n=1 Tax=Escallonia herrerae TaxID=1293975 RepID=A0AA88VLP2_9ASTE|nr:hypothetical protein RJ639_013839 [Escallonia herrerae]
METINFSGSRFQGTMVTKSSFICQDLLPGSLLHPQQYEKKDCCMHIKLEDGAAYCPQSAISVLNGQPQPKSFFPSYGHEKHSAPPHQHVNNTTARSESSAGSKRYPHDKEGSNIFTSIEGEGFIVFDSASNVKGSLEISDYGRALSLLSTQPQNSSTHASRDVMTHSRSSLAAMRDTVQLKALKSSSD